MLSQSAIKTIYQQRVEQFDAEYKIDKRKEQWISSSRILIAIFLLLGIVYAFMSKMGIYYLLPLLLLLVFLYLVKLHDKYKWRLHKLQALIDINRNEINFLDTQKSVYADGGEFVDTHHPYTYDLDIFGNGSLYQYLNRTQTYIGHQSLAQSIIEPLKHNHITSHQLAVAELSEELNWRQEIMALGIMLADSKSYYTNLLAWADKDITVPPLWARIFAYLGPIAFVLAILSYAVLGSDTGSNMAYVIFLINLLVLAYFLKPIKGEMFAKDGVSDPIKLYAHLLSTIESKKFQSNLLQNLQSSLTEESVNASNKLSKLGHIFSQLDSISSGLGAIIMNGTMLYHLHAYNKLVTWKKSNANRISQWLEVIGQLEQLSSLANFSFNNPDFVYPTINSEAHISYRSLGHPLIKSGKRIHNDVSLKDHPYILLTGSNMSGKSTFLRTIGVNHILASMGSVVCALEATVDPLPLYVSMRISDSLMDSESYFFSEVKRLKEILDYGASNRSLILLDEILRGTNSDDKRGGTIGVIHKLVANKAIGAIATHDLEVCNTTDHYPHYLKNMCFEVEIINDELVFDYRLRAGICKNKSATFLMKKMNIIQ